MIDTNIVEMRSLAPAELAEIIASSREKRQWSQETLAELAKISVRTVQRVESGNYSPDRDTKRALAVALEWEDIDVFNKQWPFPSEEKIKKIKEEEKRLNETTTLVTLEAGLSGRKLRTLIEGTQAMSIHEYTELYAEASVVFAELQDYMRDYLDVYSDFSAVDKINIDRDFQAAIDKLREMDIEIGVGTRRMNVTSDSWKDKTPLKFLVVHIVVGRCSVFPSSIRLPKQSPLI